MKFISIFNYELSCTINIKRYVAILLIFLLLSLYLVFAACIDYGSFLAEKKDFLKLEREKLKNYLNYEQYGAYGFDVLFDIDPLSIYFHRPEIIKSNVSTKQLYNVHSTWKGKYVLKNWEMAFADFLYFAGCLIMLFYGVLSFRSVKQITFFKSFRFMIYTSLSRLIIANLFFIFILFLAFILPYLFGIEINGGLFFLFSLNFLAYSTLIFWGGVGISFLKKFSGQMELTAIFFFLIFVYGIPGTMGVFNGKKGIERVEDVKLKISQNTMNYEREINTDLRDQMRKVSKYQLRKNQGKYARKFLGSVFLENEKLDKKISRDLKRFMEHYETTAIFVPSIFYRLLNAELSSYSSSNNIEFVNYIHRLSKDFFNYYIEKRFESDRVETDVKSFVSNQENVYKSKSKLPGIFFKSLSVSAFYIALFFCAILFLYRLLFKIKGEDFWVEWDELKKGKTYFYLTDSPEKKNSFLNTVRKAGIDVIDFSKTTDFVHSIKNCSAFIKMACRCKGIDPDIFYKELKGVLKDLDHFDDCSFNLTLVMMILKGNPDYIVLDDFFSRVGQCVERKFLDILAEKETTVIFLSSHMFSDYIESKVRNFDHNRLVLIDLKKVTFN